LCKYLNSGESCISFSEVSIEKLLASHVVLVSPDSVAVLLGVLLSVTQDVEEVSIFASLEQAISVQVNDIENLRQGLFALCETVDGLNEADCLLSLRVAHCVPSIALRWLGDGSPGEGEDVGADGDGEPENIA